MYKNYIFVVVIILILLVIYKQYNLYLFFEQELPEWSVNNEITHILFTRYKEEDMSQVLRPFVFKKNVQIFIYNKGNNIPNGIPDNLKGDLNVTIIDIPNLGWDSYAYFKHVIDNYDNLPDKIYLFHASAQYMDYKYVKMADIIYKTNILPTIDSSEKLNYYGSDIKTEKLDFMIDNHSAAYMINRLLNKEHTFVTSPIYPLKNWLYYKLGKIPKNKMVSKNEIYSNFHGMFMVTKSSILRYKKSFYEETFKEISVWQSEVNHYLERSWYLLYD